MHAARRRSQLQLVGLPGPFCPEAYQTLSHRCDKFAGVLGQPDWNGLAQPNHLGLGEEPYRTECDYDQFCGYEGWEWQL